MSWGGKTMMVDQHTAVDVIERLKVIQGLCQDIATRLEDEASVQTIPRNYEYEGRRTALLEIASEISKTMTTLENASDPKVVNENVRALLSQIETRKQHNQGEHERNEEFRHNFRMSSLYFTPKGAIAGCEKALEWLYASLKLDNKQAQ
jgi:hypothetical protein